MSQRKRKKEFRLKTNGQIIIDTRRHSTNPLRSIQPDISTESALHKAHTLITYLQTCSANSIPLGLSWNQYNGSITVPGRVCIVRPSLRDQWIILINPYIVSHSKKDVWSRREGCLSSPGKYVNVRRYVWSEVKYLNERGKEVSKYYRSLLGYVIQHEIDHLDGIFFTDSIRK